MEFRVSSGGSTALCTLAFDTNLRKIDFAEVTKTVLKSEQYAVTKEREKVCSMQVALYRCPAN